MSHRETTVFVNSAYKADHTGSNCNFSVNFRGGINGQNVKHVGLVSAIVPNMFFNVYGKNRFLYVDAGGGNPNVTVEIPAGHYTSAGALATAIASALQTTIGGGTFSGTASAAGVITISNATRGVTYSIYGAAYVRKQFGVHTSMNSVMGVGVADTSFALSHVMPDTVALNGVRRVYVSSDKLAHANTTHSSGFHDSIVAVIPLHDTPYGFTTSHEFNARENNSHVFRDTIDCNTIDIKLLDEHLQVLSLPDNQHFELELILAHEN